MVFSTLLRFLSLCRILRCSCPCLPVWTFFCCLYDCLSSCSAEEDIFTYYVVSFVGLFCFCLSFCFLFFIQYFFYLLASPVFLHGDDVFCRLLSCPLSFCLFSLFYSLTVFPIWFAYLVTTAGFVADQLMCDKQQKQNVYDHGLDFDVRMYYVKINHSKIYVQEAIHSHIQENVVYDKLLCCEGHAT